MKLEGLFIYLIVFSISLAFFGSGLFDSLIQPQLTGASLGLAAQKCSDGTVYGKCSLNKPLQCSNGQLVSNCTKCGCSNNMSCIAGLSCNTPPSVRNPTIASVDNSNLAGRALNCSGLLVDADKDSLNVTVLWSFNGASNYSFGYSNNYANGARFGATLGGGSVLAGSWYCQITAYDNKNYSTNRSNTLQISDYVCSDDTPSGQCSITKPNYCFNYGLVSNCTACGCPSGQSCNASTNSCYSIIVQPQNCSDGTPSGQCSVTLPKYCQNGVFVNNCTSCGCSSGQSCNTTSNACYTPVVLPQNCSDGTVYGNCSSTRPKYCSNGTLLDNCSECGCPAGRSCNVTNNTCYVPMCTDGTPYNLCSVTNPKYCNNGTLVNNCSVCGCTIGLSCNSTTNTCYAPNCSDGTLYGQCAAIKPIYCQNGTLTNNCTDCGCPISLSCNPLNNSCYVPNNPPTVSSPILMSTFGTNTTSEDLNCSSQIADSDGDLMNVTANWYKNDEIAVTILYKDMANGTAISVLKSSNLSTSDWWQCNIIATDGKSVNNSGFSTKVKILASPSVNIPPHTPTPLLNSSDGSNTTTSNLNCYDTIMDPNDDRMNATVVWLVNGTPATAVDYTRSMDSGSFFNAVLPSSNLSIGDTWACRIRLYDGMNYSDWGVSNSLNIVMPLVPSQPQQPSQPPTQQQPGGGGGGGASPSVGAPTNGSTPSQPAPACINKLEVTVPENIYIPQRVTKLVSLMVTNKGTCPISSVAANLALPLGMKSNLYILDKGLGVNESQMISLTVLPTDAPAGQYPMAVKLDAPNVSISKSATIWLLENPSFVASIGGVSELKVFEYIIVLILIDFVFGSVILLIWYRPKKDEDEIPEPIKPRQPIHL